MTGPPTGQPPESERRPYQGRRSAEIDRGHNRNVDRTKISRWEAIAQAGSIGLARGEPRSQWERFWECPVTGIDCHRRDRAALCAVGIFPYVKLQVFYAEVFAEPHVIFHVPIWRRMNAVDLLGLQLRLTMFYFLPADEISFAIHRLAHDWGDQVGYVAATREPVQIGHHFWLFNPEGDGGPP